MAKKTADIYAPKQTRKNSSSKVKFKGEKPSKKRGK